jgi:hypothetical protein
MLQAAPETLDIAMGEITDKASGKPRMTAAAFARGRGVSAGDVLEIA